MYIKGMHRLHIGRVYPVKYVAVSLFNQNIGIMLIEVMETNLISDLGLERCKNADILIGLFILNSGKFLPFRYSREM